MQEYRLVERLVAVSLDESPTFLQVTENQVYQVLRKLNSAKACGPDAISNWMVKEYNKLLVGPITKMLNASFKEQRLPSISKHADVTPLPKQRPVRELKKDLRPISLTPCLSKIAEEFVVGLHGTPAVLQILDECQYGAVPKSSTTLILLDMLNNWAMATDRNGATVRIMI
ncbi:uncharacterized protein [Montipora foliosa]|uniref:uncharacterized protein n=1 Tax=Montipora foliosa TaxID=591990 RepID=UPI0035F11587